MTHWTQDLKAENAALRAALDVALKALATIPASRIEKARLYPDEPIADLAYVTCAQEVQLRADEARNEALDLLADRGILL